VKPAALIVATLIVALFALLLRSEHTTAPVTAATTSSPLPPVPLPEPVPVPPQPSRAIGLPYAGRLEHGVQLPVEGADFFTWDPILKQVPNRDWRRWATDRLLAVLARVLSEYRLAHPGVARVGVGDLSRPHGGNFGPRFGAPGHASHQNGLDADVYYPRRDGLERRPRSPGMVDRALAQDLVDRFVEAGAQFVFVGPHVRLHGPRKVVQPLRLHDDHMHVRLRRR
jgi:murein endopeptidase